MYVTFTRRTFIAHFSLFSHTAQQGILFLDCFPLRKRLMLGRSTYFTQGRKHTSNGKMAEPSLERTTMHTRQLTSRVSTKWQVTRFISLVVFRSKLHGIDCSIHYTPNQRSRLGKRLSPTHDNEVRQHSLSRRCRSSVKTWPNLQKALDLTLETS